MSDGIGDREARMSAEWQDRARAAIAAFVDQFGPVRERESLLSTLSVLGDWLHKQWLREWAQHNSTGERIYAPLANEIKAIQDAYNDNEARLNREARQDARFPEALAAAYRTCGAISESSLEYEATQIVRRQTGTA